MKKKKLVLGLVASGKSTLYRQVNELKKFNAVEIELPQSCTKDEALKSALLSLYVNDDNIDMIITHPYYLSQDYLKYLNQLELFYLDIPLKERLERIQLRSASINTNSNNLFPVDFISTEEESFKKFLIANKNRVQKWID